MALPLTFFVLIALLLIAAFFSATEVALFSLTKIQLRQIRLSHTRRYYQIQKLLDKPSELLLTILIANEMVNIASATLIATWISDNWTFFAAFLPPVQLPSWILQTIVSILVATPVVLIVCELTPKVIASHNNKWIALISAQPVQILHRFFFPLRKLIHLLTPESRMKKREIASLEAKQNAFINEEDVLIVAEESLKEGTLGASEFQWIQNVFQLNDTKIGSICTPIEKAFTLAEATSVSDAIQLLNDAEFTRVPVLSKSRTSVLGILNIKDLLKAKLDPNFTRTSFKSLLLPAVTVPEDQHLLMVFRRLRRQKSQIGIVVDDQKRVKGVITMSDIFREIFKLRKSTDV